MTKDDILAHVRPMRKGNRPIVVGPWLSEVGFELLYWIPFLRWLVAEAEIPRQRLWILSRGGCRSWYGDITRNYLELYDYFTPDELRIRNFKRIREQAQHAGRIGLRMGQITAKQYLHTAIESRIVADVVTSNRLLNPHLIGPDLMYGYFRPFWRMHPFERLLQAWQGTTKPAKILPDQGNVLTGPYVAVKFYSSEACPNHDEQQASVNRIIRQLAEQIDVVLLHTGTSYDEHGEFHVEQHPRIHRLTFPHEHNLEMQTAVIAGASAFVGTYGGFAYLAPFVGVPATAYYSQANFRRDHLKLIRTTASAFGVHFQASQLSSGAAEHAA